MDMATDKGNREIIDLLSRQTAVSNPNVSYRRGRSHFMLVHQVPVHRSSFRIIGLMLGH